MGAPCEQTPSVNSIRADHIAEDTQEARSEYSLPSSRSWRQCCRIHQLPVRSLRAALLLSSISPRDNAIYDFCKKAVENGLDIFRVFDSLNYIGEFAMKSEDFVLI